MEYKKTFYIIIAIFYTSLLQSAPFSTRKNESTFRITRSSAKYFLSQSIKRSSLIIEAKLINTEAQTINNSNYKTLTVEPIMFYSSFFLIKPNLKLIKLVKPTDFNSLSTLKLTKDKVYTFFVNKKDHFLFLNKYVSQIQHITTQNRTTFYTLDIRDQSFNFNKYEITQMLSKKLKSFKYANNQANTLRINNLSSKRSISSTQENNKTKESINDSNKFSLTTLALFLFIIAVAYKKLFHKYI